MPSNVPAGIGGAGSTTFVPPPPPPPPPPLAKAELVGAPTAAIAASAMKACLLNMREIRLFRLRGTRGAFARFGTIGMFRCARNGTLVLGRPGDDDGRPGQVGAMDNEE